MSQSEFEKQIARLVARENLLRAAMRGDLKLRRVRVRAHTVPTYEIGAHWRYLPPPRQRQVTARKPGMVAA